jgi:hypothetical protein
MTGRRFMGRVAFMLFIVVIASMLSVGSVFANTPQFRLDIDSLNLQQGTSTRLTVTVENAQGAEVTSIEGIGDFDVLSNNYGMTTQIINGTVTYQESHTYTIMPKSAGQFTLWVNMKYKGKAYKTNELNVRVGESNNTGESENREIFLKTILSSDEVYYGQKIILAYELYTRYNIEGSGFLDSVDIDGFIKKEVSEDNLKANYAYVDDRKYAKYEVKQIYISPVKPGTFDIPSYNFQANVSTGGFFSSSQPMYLKSDPKQITVRPLPTSNQPADFSGIVGNLNLESSYNKKQIDLKDSLTLNVKLSGDCNLEGLSKIINGEIQGFSVYETEKSTEESIVDNQYNIQKEFEIILVPEKIGEIKIDPIQIPYFNPKSGNYEKAEIPGTVIEVQGEMPVAQGAVGNGTTSAASALETVEIDQVSYKPSSEGYLTIRFKKAHLFTGLIVFIIALIIAGGIYLLLLNRKKHDKKLSRIYNEIRNEKNPNEIYNLFNRMMKYRLDLSLKASSRSVIMDKISGYEFANPVLEIMDYMESEKSDSDKTALFLKDKIKEIYRKL